MLHALCTGQWATKLPVLFQPYLLHMSCISAIGHALQKYLVKMTTSAAVSGFIEQVGNMIKGIPKHKYYPSTPLIIPLSFKELAQTLVSKSTYSNYPVQNWLWKVSRQPKSKCSEA